MAAGPLYCTYVDRSALRHLRIPDPTMPVALALQLREGTKKSHTMAENTGFVSCFLKGVVDKASYRTLVADLFFVYSAMEEEIGRLRAEGHPVVGPVGFPELNRRETLEQDLAYYFGDSWRSAVKATPAAQEYVARIHQVGKDAPELLVGHHYTRYIGDLSGGQILKNIAQKAMSLGEHDGLRFYEFDAIPDEKGFKTNYRATPSRVWSRNPSQPWPHGRCTALTLIDLPCGTSGSRTRPCPSPSPSSCVKGPRSPTPWPRTPAS